MKLFAMIVVLENVYLLCRKFVNIFDVDHFINYLKADVGLSEI